MIQMDKPEAEIFYVFSIFEDLENGKKMNRVSQVPG
jgi:hypothetical protein